MLEGGSVANLLHLVTDLAKYLFYVSSLHLQELYIKGLFSQYHISRNFSEDPILAIVVRLFSSLKLCILNNTSHLDIMCFIINLLKIAQLYL